MRRPSLTLVLSGIFIAYSLHSMWALSQLFIAPSCTQFPCYKSFLETNPRLQLVLFTSTQVNPTVTEVTKVGTVKKFPYREKYLSNYEIEIPRKTQRNGTLYMHAVVALDDGRDLEWKELKRDGPTVIQRIKLTEFLIPRAATFNLLGEKEDPGKKKTSGSDTQIRPVAHITNRVHLSILTDSISFSEADVPPDLSRLVRANQHYQFLPIILNDPLRSRLYDYQEITDKTKKVNIEFNYAPISTGKLRVVLHVEHALKSFTQLGFTSKDIDEVKGIFSDTNVYLLCGTILVGSVHLLFDFLSFKNDVSFWKRKRDYTGLSLRTTLWRAFSQIVIFLYLLDENTSLLVLIPAGIGTLIELWKCKKILKIEITMSGFKIQTSGNETIAKGEETTRKIDREAMKYLSYVLYPLCICGALYSLIYQPHKSWYSWTVNSLVNGVYAFGFLFMLPQLFINYKLKSVAALPWRAFMYKAFNTFIDDIFAFIITMPTSHRLACFRDDIVFIIYLYQRYLYPVDKTRTDENTRFVEDVDEGGQIVLEEKKKTK